MKIDLLKYEHLRPCTEVFIAAFSCTPWNEEWDSSSAFDRLSACHKMPNFYGLVATEDSKVLGFAMGFTERWYKGYHYCLKELCVETTYQRAGTGRTIISALQKNLVDEGVDMIYFSTMQNSNAERFYRKCGFLASSELLVMTKNISSSRLEDTMN